MDLFRRFKSRKRNQPDQPSSEPRVQVWSADTKMVSTIPARELAPGMVRVKMQGVEGDVWVNPADLKQGEYRHPPFDDRLRNIMRSLAETLGEVYPISADQWEDGFRRDETAEREIAIWMHIAAVYGKVTAGRALPLEEKRDIFRVVLACANNPREHVIKTAGAEHLSQPECEAIMEEFYRSGD